MGHLLLADLRVWTFCEDGGLRGWATEGQKSQEKAPSPWEIRTGQHSIHHDCNMVGKECQMYYCEIKDWLDGIVKAMDQCKSAEWLNSSVNAYVYRSVVMINRGIDIIADVMGLQLKESISVDTDRATYSFEYKGIEFWSMYGPGFRLGGNNIDRAD